MPIADIRNAFRSLRRRPAWTTAALLTIALGVGVNTAVYSVIQAVLLEPLPFRDPNRLVQVWETHPELPALQSAYPDFLDWKQYAASFDQLAAYTFQQMNHATLAGQGNPVEVQATMVSAELFPMLGVRMLHGRAFDSREEQHQDRVALISEALWRRKFNADPKIVGRGMQLDNLSFTVLGIIPQRQAFPAWADVWMPLSLLEPMLQSTRKFHTLEVVGRLKPGVGLAQAEIEMKSIALRLSAACPDTNKTEGALVIPLARQITAEVRPALLIVWCVVGLVLLIACANVAHLMMARGIERRRELAIRVSLGASRLQLVRQFLSESVLLAVAGGALGLAFAAWTTPVLLQLAQQNIPRLDNLQFDSSVGLFAFGLSIASGLLFGLPACHQALRAGFKDGLKPGAGGRVLMASEIALAFVVLFGAALLVRSFALLLDQDPGFHPENVLAAYVPLSEAGEGSWEKAEIVLRNEMTPRLRALPGVEGVAGANCAPFRLARTDRGRYTTRFGIPGQSFEPGHFPLAQLRWITPEYFNVLGIPLKQGRLLSEHDRKSNRRVINQALARRFFPDRDPVGRELLSDVVGPNPSRAEIVGVVGDIRELGLDVEIQPTIYSLGTSPGMDLLIRTAGDPVASVPAILQAIQSVSPRAALGRAQTLENLRSSSLARRTFALWLMAVFAGLAAVLTAIGIYGIVGYGVGRRIREFGIRTAVGARPVDLLTMILRESLIAASPGLIGGVLLALAFSAMLKTQLYKISPADPVSFAGVAGLLLSLCALSAWIPAKRAAAVEPGVALREE